jgi:hypothetical protein
VVFLLTDLPSSQSKTIRISSKTVAVKMDSVNQVVAVRVEPVVVAASEEVAAGSAAWLAVVLAA